MCVACCLLYSQSVQLWLLISPLLLYTLPIVSLWMSRHFFLFCYLLPYLILHIFSPFYYLQRLFHTHYNIFHTHTSCTNIIQGLLIFFFCSCFSQNQQQSSHLGTVPGSFFTERSPQTQVGDLAFQPHRILLSKSPLIVIILDFQCS